MQMAAALGLDPNPNPSPNHWQVARLVMQMAAARMDPQHDTDIDPLQQDALEPPAPNRASPLALLGRVLSSLACFLKWLLALLGTPRAAAPPRELTHRPDAPRQPCA